MMTAHPTPLSLRVLAVLLFIFAIFAFLGSLFLWGEGFLFSFPQGVNVAFPLTDILVNAPASLYAAYGLWFLKKYGYPASQFVAGFYIYASVYIFIEVVQGGPPYPVEIVLPQMLTVIVAIGLVVYGWRYRQLFKF
jgi:hypothetical protein